MQTLVIFFLLFFFLTLNSPLQSFSLSPQTAANNITLFGDAFFTTNHNDSFSLTQELSSCRSSSSSPTTMFFPFYNNGVGRALYARPIRFLDLSTNATAASFSSSFTFSIVPSPICSSGDGIAFLILPDSATASADPISAAKGQIGLPGPLQDSFFAVEFDTSFDPLLGDADGNHVAVDVNSAVSVASIDLSPRGIDLRSGREITAWVEYRDPLSLVRVWVGYSPEPRPPDPILVAQIDLSELAAASEFVFVGFSASNGHGSSLHVITEWKFKTFHRHVSLLLPIDTLEEGDCFVCPKTATIINSNKSLTESVVSDEGDHLTVTGSKKDEILGIGGLVAFLVSALVVAGVVAFAVTRKRRLARRRRAENLALGGRRRNNGAPARLSLAEIREATMGFDRGRIVGRGASATVYRGSLPSSGGGEVAVKRFQRLKNRAAVACSSSNNNHPFANEFATVIGCLRHKNLVQLRGWCCEDDELVLVYEYMPNGSLDKFLHYHHHSLTWRQRLGVAVGVAAALTYLHEECERRILHRDVKSSNVMLDSDFTAKLGDFGLAAAASSAAGMTAAGTMGYMAPEYVVSGAASEKSDVYGFGVVVLEVGTGRRAVEEGVVEWAWGMWERGRLREAVDPRLTAAEDRREAQGLVAVGLACVHPNHVKRPTAREAGRILRGEVLLPPLPARRPRLRAELFDELGSENQTKSLSGDNDDDDDRFLTPKTNFS